MRTPATSERVHLFMDRLGRAAREEVRVYLVGGTSAVLFGWRETTKDVDVKFVPEANSLFAALPALKEALQLNVEMAAPDQFVPALPGWESRSIWVTSVGKVQFYHYDLYGQALAKIERGHAQDKVDVAEMIARGLVDKMKLMELFEAIEPKLIQYPAIDPASFRRKVQAVCAL